MPMFEDLLNSLGLGNGKPTQQGKDALNNLLANTGTGATYNELTQQEEGANALNNLLANAAPTGTAPIQYTPTPQQPTALDNLINGRIPGFQDFAKGAVDYGMLNVPTANGAFLGSTPGKALQLLGKDNELQFAQLTDSNGPLNAKAGNLDNYLNSVGIEHSGNKLKLGGKWYDKSDIGNALAGYAAGSLGLSDSFLKGGAFVQEEKNLKNLQDEVGRDWKFYDAGFGDSGYEGDVSKLLKGLGNVGSDILSSAKQGINSIVNKADNVGDNIVNEASNIAKKISSKGSSFVDKIKDSISTGGDILKNELKYQYNYQIPEVTGKDIMDFGRRAGTIGGSLLNIGKLGIDNTINEIKYTNGTLNDSEKNNIQNYYNQNIDKYIAGEMDEKSFLDGVNKYTNQKGLLQGFKSVDDVAGLLNDTRTNTNKAVIRNKDWNFLTDEQKGYDDKLSNQTKEDPIYKGFEQYYQDFAGKDKGIDPYVGSNIRGGYETLKSDLEYSIQKQKSTLIGMDNSGATETEKQQYKEQSDKLINAQYNVYKSLLDDIQEAASKKADFDTFATEKYKDVGGIDGLIRQSIRDAGVTSMGIDASNFTDASDQLSSDIALNAGGVFGAKQGAVAVIGKVFEQSDKAVRAIQGGVGAEFSSAGLAGLSNVNFSKDVLYQKGVASFAGEAATLVPDLILTFYSGPAGAFKTAGSLGRIGSGLRKLETASSVAKGLAYAAGGTLEGLDYAKRGLQLARDVATLNVLDEINLVGKARGSKLLQGLSDAHISTLENIAIKTGKVAQELARDNAISGLISRYTADAYGGQESNRWNDVYVDSAFNVFDVWGGLRSAGRALDGLKRFESGITDEVLSGSGLNGTKSLGLRQAEKLGEDLDAQVYTLKGFLDKKTPDEFKRHYEGITGQTLTGDESLKAMNELKLKLARNIIETVDNTKYLGTTPVEQLSKLKQIDEIVRDPNIAPNGLVSFITEGSASSIARSQGLGVGVSSLLGREIGQRTRLAGDVIAQNSLNVKPNSLGETLGLTVPKINESEVNRIEGILSSQDKKLDDYFTKQDDGSYVLKEDKYNEVGVVEQEVDLLKKLYDNKIIDEKTQTELAGLNAVDVLSKAIGTILC